MCILQCHSGVKMGSYIEALLWSKQQFHQVGRWLAAMFQITVLLHQDPVWSKLHQSDTFDSRILWSPGEFAVDTMTVLDSWYDAGADMLGGFCQSWSCALNIVVSVQKDIVLEALCLIHMKLYKPKLCHFSLFLLKPNSSVHFRH